MGGHAGGGGEDGAGGIGGGAAGAGGVGPENCFNGLDDDGDGLNDCLHHDPDCPNVCTPGGDACNEPVAIADPTIKLLGDNTEHAVLNGVSCETTQPGLAGNAIVYKISAAKDGILDASATPKEMGKGDLVVTVRSDCSDPATELGCGDTLGAECVHVPVKKGEKYFVAVAGYSALTYGPYLMTAFTRARQCGDTVLDPPESCDDGNAKAGDGCSDTCAVEISEIEPNDDVAGANSFAEPMLGAISPAGDVDVISFAVGKDNSSLVVTTTEMPGKGCAKKLIDSYMELVGSDGTTVLAKNDDGANGVIAKISYPGLAVGTYYLRLKASPGAPPKHTFTYRWSLMLTP